MFLKTINFVKTSNHAFKQTRCYNGCLQGKIQSDRFSHIHTYAGIFRYSQAQSEITRHFQELLRGIQAHLEASVTLAYSEPWHIQNQTHIQKPSISRTRPIFRTLLYSRSQVYSKPSQTSAIESFTKIMQILLCTIFQIGQIPTFRRPVPIRPNQCSTFWHIQS